MAFQRKIRIGEAKASLSRSFPTAQPTVLGIFLGLLQFTTFIFLVCVHADIYASLFQCSCHGQGNTFFSVLSNDLTFGRRCKGSTSQSLVDHLVSFTSSSHLSQCHATLSLFVPNSFTRRRKGSEQGGVKRAKETCKFERVNSREEGTSSFSVSPLLRIEQLRRIWESIHLEESANNISHRELKLQGLKARATLINAWAACLN